jgi:hypothetical protein
LPENVQLIEKRTRARRAEPPYSSEVLGKSFQYSQEQLEIKAQSHLQKDYDVSSEGMTKNEQGLSYKALIEDLLQTPNLIVQEHGTMNHQESATIFFDPDSTLFASFENNPLYEDHHFVTLYKINKDAVNEFIKTGNIGESTEMREAKIDQDQRLKAIQKQIQVNEQLFYQILPKDAHIGNKQLREVEKLQEQLQADPNVKITAKEKALLERAERYAKHKETFSRNTQDKFNNEL